ncbi:transglycosylase domain-containing protein [Streptomyces paludis]|uniref:transglycosylase domain-containing protein n=1 Tax=Streptomyces paludis TaxID=2282738 RepID=UPI001E2940D6|nr:transglycosylase domain-containing protein [Streptomyces paludis]
MKPPHTRRTTQSDADWPHPGHPDSMGPGGGRAGGDGRRLIDYPRAGRQNWLRWVPSWRLLAGAGLASFGALAGLGALIYVNIEIPAEHDVARRQATVYYWADGKRMVSVGDVNRQEVALEQVPVTVQRAVVATENAGFYSDSGVSFKGIARAGLNMLKGEATQGGSTITQQFVKNAYLSQDQTISRKAREFFLSLKITNERPKEQILEGYLNTSWFGRDSYGIQAAAQAYYGISARDLNASQAALLTGLLKGADTLDPSLSPAHHERAERRWNYILDRQVETGAMTAAERATYTEFPEPKLPVKPNSQAGQIGYLVDIANKYLKNRSNLTDQDLADGGLRIYTTFEKDKVLALAGAVDRVRRQNLAPETRESDRNVQVGAASVRVDDGAVVAVYGGEDAVTHFTNNADTSGVPAGSAFKPFVYAAALEFGGPGFVPADSTGAPSELGLGESLVRSQNDAFIAAGENVGLDRVKNMAVAAGLREDSMAQLDPSFTVGTSTPSAVRLASAYTAFAGDGTGHEPYSVTRVERNGTVLSGFNPPQARRAMDPAVALEVGEALQQLGVTALGPSTLGPTRDQWFGAPVWAGATGAEDGMNSAWFIGATKVLSTSVTMFRSSPDTARLLTMDGVGGVGSERGTIFPPQIWSDYQLEVAPDSFVNVPLTPVLPVTPTPTPTEPVDDGVPADDAPVGGTPGDGTPEDGTGGDGDPADGNVVDENPVNDDPANGDDGSGSEFGPDRFGPDFGTQTSGARPLSALTSSGAQPSGASSTQRLSAQRSDAQPSRTQAFGTTS